MTDTRELTADEKTRLKKTLPVGSTQIRETRVNGKVVAIGEAPIIGRAMRRKAARALRRGAT